MAKAAFSITQHQTIANNTLNILINLFRDDSLLQSFFSHLSLFHQLYNSTNFNESQPLSELAKFTEVPFIPVSRV